MKIHTITLLLFSTVLFITGCKKEDIGEPFPKVRTRTNEMGYTYTHTYRGDGKALTVKGSDGYSSVYSYSGNTIKVNLESGENNQVTPYQEYTLSSTGLISTMVIQFDSNTTTTTYEYNSDGKLIRTHNTYATEILEWEDGNLMKSITTSLSGTTVYSYTYYTDMNNSLSDKVYGLDFFGNDSKNLIKSRNITYNGQTDVSNYTYEFDSKDRVTKKVDTRSAGVIRSETYTYY